MAEYDHYDYAGRHEGGNYYNPLNPNGINSDELSHAGTGGTYFSANPKTMRWIIVILFFAFFILPYLIF